MVFGRLKKKAAKMHEYACQLEKLLNKSNARKFFECGEPESIVMDLISVAVDLSTIDQSLGNYGR